VGVGVLLTGALIHRLLAPLPASVFALVRPVAIGVGVVVAIGESLRYLGWAREMRPLFQWTTFVLAFGAASFVLARAAGKALDPALYTLVASALGAAAVAVALDTAGAKQSGASLTRRPQPYCPRPWASPGSRCLCSAISGSRMSAGASGSYRRWP
jgi:hypothetical protein